MSLLFHFDFEMVVKATDIKPRQRNECKINGDKGKIRQMTMDSEYRNE